VARKRVTKSAVEFVSVPTPRLVVTDELEPSIGVAGAHVKVTPLLRRSERGTVDVAAVKKRLLGLGALSVSVLPRFVPDESAARAAGSSDRVDPREEVRAMLADEPAALEQAMSFFDEAGL